MTYVFSQVLEDKEEFFEMSTLAQLGHHSKPYELLDLLTLQERFEVSNRMKLYIL
jgi:hypothetical protein